MSSCTRKLPYARTCSSNKLDYMVSKEKKFCLHWRPVNEHGVDRWHNHLHINFPGGAFHVMLLPGAAFFTLGKIIGKSNRTWIESVLHVVLKTGLNDFGLYKINSIIAYSLAPWFTKKMLLKIFVGVLADVFDDSTCREPPWQNRKSLFHCSGHKKIHNTRYRRWEQTSTMCMCRGPRISSCKLKFSPNV